LLRGTVGMTVAMQAWRFVASSNTDLLGAAPAAGLVVCGVALTAGIFTPICCAILGVGYALVLLTSAGGVVLPPIDPAAAVVGLAAVTALAPLGPGAFSIDARLFGRRAIFIPAPVKEDSEQA
jgi:uncharacterized membrane protein YphA (DoxX/SURF4 family)